MKFLECQKGQILLGINQRIFRDEKIDPFVLHSQDLLGDVLGGSMAWEISKFPTPRLLQLIFLGILLVPTTFFQPKGWVGVF